MFEPKAQITGDQLEHWARALNEYARQLNDAADPALLAEVRALRADVKGLREVQLMSLVLQRRWDIEGLPFRRLDDDLPDPTESASDGPRTPPVPGPAAAEGPSADSRPAAPADDPAKRDRPE